MPAPDTPLQFGDFTIDVGNARLWRAGQAVALPPKAFDLLALLLQRPGELVTKDELLDQVWGRRFVSEGAIKTVVSELRAALGDDVRAPRWIATVPRRGYRFIGTREVAAGRPGPSAALATPAAAAALPAGAAAPAGNLGRQAPRLIGREAALAELLGLLAQHPLVTLVGPGGVGKTQLALAAAAQQPAPAGGTWWVELAPLAAGADAAALRSTLAHALQVAPAGVASDDDLCRSLQGQPLWVLLDNAEHVLASLAPWLAKLHERLPALRWLVTSREPLHLRGEQVMRLAPLALPAVDDAAGIQASAAVQLFAQRVAARLPGFVVQPAQQVAVARLCRALDGLPLALELAAARVPVLGVHGLAEQLTGEGHQLNLLTQGPRDALPHQRTMRAAVDWSCALLTPPQLAAFRRLAVFRGSFSLAAAQTVVADEDNADADGAAGLAADEVLDLVSALVEKSLLVVVPPAQDGQPPRFVLLETLRESAQARLQAAGEVATVQRRHLRAAREHWARADARALSEQVLPWTALQALELENLRAALRWGVARVQAATPAPDALCLDLAALLAHSSVFWARAGFAAEGADWCRQVGPALAGRLPPLDQALWDLGQVNLSRFTRFLPPQDSVLRMTQAAEVLAAAGQAERAYYAHYLRWTQELELDERAGGSRALQQMRALVGPQWSPLLRRFLDSAQAHDDRLAGRTEASLASSRAQWAVFQQMGAQGESWSAGLALMLAEHDAGRPAEALAIGRTLMDGIRRAGRLRTYGQCASFHATMLAESGDLPATRAALAETLPLLPAMTACEVLYLALAWLAHHEGRDEAAAQLLGWFESPQRGGGSHGQGTFQWRTAQSLAQRLAERLGAAALARQRAAGAGLGQAGALALGSAGPGAAPADPPPGPP